LNLIKKNSESFRDLAGQVYYCDDRIIRVIRKKGKERFDHILKNNIIEQSVDKNFLIESKKLKITLKKLILMKVAI
jgi:hypothetical protein|tara:strand:+ start:242 stop:469 length:228 start_codon:yes stop_codon:yes gene_type:complete